MYRINGKIQGVAPLLFNRFTEEAQEGLKKAATGGRFTDEQRIAEAMEKVYRGEKGLYLPAWNFKRVMVEGCRKAGLKEGRASAAPFLEATVFADGQLWFGKDEPDFIHETWGRRPPKTGGACIVRRPALDVGWELPFGLTVVDDRRSDSQIRRAVEEGGLLCGLGSWRPEYGRFVVVEWSVER